MTDWSLISILTLIYGLPLLVGIPSLLLALKPPKMEEKNMGGEMMDELRAISATSKRITQTQLRLALAATAEVATSVADLRGTMNEQFTRLMNAIEAQNANIEIIKDQLEGVERRITTCDSCQSRIVAEQVKRNLFFRLGAWITEHPKAAMSVLGFSVILFLVLMTLWMNPDIRRITFEFLKFPNSVVNSLAQ